MGVNVGSGRQRIAIINTIAEIARVAEIVEEFCAGHDVPPGTAFKLNVVVEELLVNTISYGFPDEGSHQIDMEIGVEGSDVIITLDDDGVAFDPLADAPPPDLDSAIEDRKIGGLGVFFVKTMMDEVKYVREAGRNRIVLKKRIAE